MKKGLGEFERVSLPQQRYIESILELGGRDGYVCTSELAAHLDVRLPSVSEAVKRLVKRGFAVRKSRFEIGLTERGRRIAEQLDRRQKALEHRKDRSEIAANLAELAREEGKKAGPPARSDIPPNAHGPIGPPQAPTPVHTAPARNPRLASTQEQPSTPTPATKPQGVEGLRAAGPSKRLTQHTAQPRVQTKPVSATKRSVSTS